MAVPIFGQLTIQELNNNASPNWHQNRLGTKNLAYAENPRILYISQYNQQSTLRDPIQKVLQNLPTKKPASITFHTSLYSGSLTLPFRTDIFGNYDLIIFDTVAEDEMINGDPILVRQALEGAIRQIQKEKEKEKENTEILIIYSATLKMTSSYLEGENPPLIKECEKVAKHYKIPSINICREAAARLSKGQLNKENIKDPGVCTLLTAAALNRFFKPQLIKETDGDTGASYSTKRKRPAPFDENCTETPRSYSLKEADDLKGIQILKNNSTELEELFEDIDCENKLSTDVIDNSFSIIVKGNVLGLLIKTDQKPGQLAYQTNGNPSKTMLIDGKQGYPFRLLLFPLTQKKGDKQLSFTSFSKNIEIIAFLGNKN